MNHGDSSRKHEGTPGAEGASPTPGTATRSEGKGQKVSSERGSHTRSKKNPGKRAHKGGSSR